MKLSYLPNREAFIINNIEPYKVLLTLHACSQLTANIATMAIEP
jgi:hypothetical protein